MTAVLSLPRGIDAGTLATDVGNTPTGTDFARHLEVGSRDSMPVGLTVPGLGDADIGPSAPGPTEFVCAKQVCIGGTGYPTGSVGVTVVPTVAPKHYGGQGMFYF